jgi:hypothetical protein
MPFKSAKQKKTIDAAAHNPAFAKKVGVKVSDAKKMSAHGKGQKFEEAVDTVEKDDKGNVKSWKHEGDWKKSTMKNPAGRAPNLSDKARRKTEKMSKAEKEMSEAFDNAISEVKVTSGPNKGKEWSPKTPGPTNPDFKDDGSMGPSDGATAPPPGYKPPKSKPMKKAEVTPTDTVSTDTEVAESKKKPSKIKTAMKMNKIKSLKENIKLVSQLLAEAKKGKCNHTNEGTKCPVHGMKECSMEEGLKGGQKKIAKAAPPTNKITGADFKALKSKKVEETTEEKCNHTAKGKKCPVHGLKECGSGMYEGSKVDQNKDGKNDFEDVKIARLKAAAKGKKKIKESYSKEDLARKLFEHEDDQMSNDESSMSKGQLVEIVKNATAIFKGIKDNENLDAWVASYITIANDHLNSVAERMSGEQVEQEMSPEDEYMESLRQHLNSLKG